MMTEADFAALSEHLVEVRPIFDEFCAQSGFVHVAKTAIGRYPRVRIARERLTRLYFDLWMDWNEEGRRFEKFRRNLPYSLYAGASIIDDSGAGCRIRFQKGITCFSGKPFDQVGAVLLSEMQKHLPVVELWDAQHLREKGKEVQLRS
jgi:hypothetical protein